MDLGLAGKVAVVTGGSKGIGRATALAFAQEGARVVVCARGQAALDEVVHECNTAGAEALGVVADVSSRDDLARLFDAAAARFGGVDCLVNNAGEAPRGAAAVTDEGWLAHLEQYLMSVVRACELAVPMLGSPPGVDAAVLLATAGAFCHGGTACRAIRLTARRDELDEGEAQRLFGFLGVSTFALATLLGLLIYAGQGATPLLQRLAPLVAVAVH